MVVHAFRTALRRPLSSFAIVALLAIGIAAVTTVFSAVDALLLRPLPVHDPYRLVRLVYVHPVIGPQSYFPSSVVDSVERDTTTLERVAGSTDRNVGLTIDGASERVRLQLVTPGYYSLLGVHPLIGREPGRDEAAVLLSYAYWQSRFNGDPSVVGRKLLLQEQPFVIAGVLPEGFNGTTVDSAPEIRAPFRVVRLVGSEYSAYAAEFEVLGRLKPGVTVQQAAPETIRLGRKGIEEATGDKELADYMRNWAKEVNLRLDAIPNGVSRIRPQLSKPALFVLGAAALLLLTVCANVSGILLARSVSRRHETAIRMAVGASAGRVAAGMLAEALVLAVAGSLAGTALAYALLPVLARALPPVRLIDATTVMPALHLAIDTRVLLASLAATAAATLLTGAAPALHAMRSDLQSLLRAARTPKPGWMRQGLVAVQVALCTVLLGGALLAVHSLHNLRTLDAGFDRDHVAVFAFDPSSARYTPQHARGLEARLLDRTRALPGVRAAAIAGRGLMRGTGLKATITHVGQKATPPDNLNTSIHSISQGYFETLGIRLLAGREFRGDEVLQKPQPVIVNQVFARHFFPDTDPIGRRVGFSGDRVVLGVVSDAYYRSLREPIPPTIYYLNHPDSVGPTLLHVRAAAGPAALIPSVREILRELEPRVPFYEIRTLAEDVNISLWNERMTASLSTLFAGFSAVTVGLGLFALLAYLVAQATRDIGIRVAVGARPSHILSWIARTAVPMIVCGFGLGLVALYGASQWIAPMLYGVAANDVRVLAACGVFIGLAGAAGTLAPALRAMRIQPAIALRHE
jgi:predicted permease